MEYVSEVSGTQPLEDADDFDPYGDSSVSKSEEKPESRIPQTAKELEPANSVPATESKDPLPGLGGAEHSTTKHLSPSQTYTTSQETDSQLVGLSDAKNVEGDFSQPNANIAEELPAVLRETSLRSPVSTSEPSSSLPGLSTLNAEHSAATNGREERNTREPTIIPEEVQDAERALLPSEATLVEPESANSGAEVEYDSSPYETSSEESSSDDSDDSDDDYEMLDPVEQARRLMEGDGSDDEGGKATSNGQLKTANEKTEEVIEIPTIEGISELQIEELGNVESKVDNMILIKAKTSGEYQVLESGSVLCLSDRTVIGVVSETLGRVQEPLYCVRFTDAATIAGLGVEKATPVFYLPQHSTFVFTQALKAVKGTDASNIHDEEIGGDDPDFSDDEAEAEYKRQKKAQMRGGKGQQAGSGRGRGGGQRRENRNHESAIPSVLSYDDVSIDEGLYTPLQRPASLNSPGQAIPPINSSDGYSRGPGGMRGRGNRGRGGYSGRGNRDSQPDRRYNQSNGPSGPNFSAQTQYPQQANNPTPNHYSQGQQQIIYSQSQPYQQPGSFQPQGQYQNQFQHYQSNQYPGPQQQQPQQYDPNLWAAYQQFASGQPPVAQSPINTNPPTQTNAPAAPYFNLAAFYQQQYQQQQQQHQPPPG